MNLLSFIQKAPMRWEAPPVIPDGHRVYAVGDVHGHDALLNQLLRLIEADIESRGPAEVTIVFLGDLIDRGPGSAQVIERLRTYRPVGARVEFLIGNHEEVLINAWEGDETVGLWRERFATRGLTGLQDAPRSGRPRSFSPRGTPPRCHPGL